MIQNSNSKKNSDEKKPMPSNNDKPKVYKTTAACDNCRQKRVRCIYENEGPCERCIKDKCRSKCIFSQRLKRGPRKITGSSTGLPTKAEFQEWGEVLWRLHGSDKQAVSFFLRILSSAPSNFGQNIQPEIFGNVLELDNEQPSWLSNLNPSFGETFLGNEQGPSDLIRANILSNNPDGRSLPVNNELFSQKTPSINLFDPQEAPSTNLFDNFDNNLEINVQSLSLSGDLTESFLTSDGYAPPEIRSPRSTSRQYSLHRSQSRDNRHNRQETRSHRPVSRSPSPNYMYSDEEQNLTLFPYSQVCYSPGHLSPNIPINYCTSNNSSASTSAHIPSSPRIPFDLDDTNLVDYINLQVMSVNSNSDEMNQHLLINSTTDIQTSSLDDSEEMPFSDYL
ncbi:14331_t:CDS:1 [Cetraspora pellucida]|uniref:14331_t:CDS:1 n=1 Tax=Cetraspora pellucida TaxID=1433469 RepID=A0ACA9LGM1_9GLOM|nr:14331_t:CDS:1 [Cetraspora pellucida]